jgi:hypothetical protein
MKSVERESCTEQLLRFRYNNSYSKESINCFMYGVVQPLLIKDIMVLQNCTNSENILVGPYGEMYSTSHDAIRAMNIKTEEVSDVQEDADPVQITVQEMKAEPEVSCVFLYVHC